MIFRFHTTSKNPKKPDENEDRCVIIPGMAYAVIDGVSDKSGMRFDGMPGGQIAGQTIEKVIRDLCGSSNGAMIDVEVLLKSFETEFERLANKYGIDEIGGAQMVLVLEDPTRFRFIIIGDTGLRINGNETYMAKYLIDDFCALIRTVVWHHLEKHDVDIVIRDAVSRAYAVNGLGAVLAAGASWINEVTLRELRVAVVRELADYYPTISERLLEKTLLGGLRIQANYVNRVHELGFPCIDGKPIPREFIIHFDRKRDDIETIELFSDGYFECPRGRLISDWENHFDHIEAVDPNKLAKYRSTKGSTDGTFADDRTVLLLENPNYREQAVTITETN